MKVPFELPLFDFQSVESRDVKSLYEADGEDEAPMRGLVRGISVDGKEESSMTGLLSW